MDFASDNTSGASGPVMAALMAANAGAAMPYGVDPWTAEAEKAVAALFERDCAVFLVPSGTAANALALAALTPPHGAIFCHEDAHIANDECGAPEFFSAGAKLVGLPGQQGRIALATLEAALARFPRGLVKQVQPAALSLTQATECGTLYSLEEIAAEMAGKVKIVKMNVDENPGVPGTFGIRSIPTLILFKDGKAASQKVGAAPKSDLVTRISSGL